ncbi:MAG: class I SAM-dependent methyltransferase [Candidatus Obscuribacterales bacterium]|nr:class I SAM-dependent methyltransferase [Candidatus Obscuribacterales bacterium]
MTSLSWEQAVEWLRNQPDQRELTEACYFDDPAALAAERFYQSQEWQSTRSLLPRTKGKALDLGAGRGISSYALARDQWNVTALEPDPSTLVGAGAIKQLFAETGLEAKLVTVPAETLPFSEGSFDLVYGRQVLHHAHDLHKLCSESHRVLTNEGTFVAVREHVISKADDLQAFLDNHPLHRFYGGENAYTLAQYKESLDSAGFKITLILGPWESVINYFPMTFEECLNQCISPLRKFCGTKLAMRLASGKSPQAEMIRRLLAKKRTAMDNTPGRLYSFICRKKQK